MQNENITHMSKIAEMRGFFKNALKPQTAQVDVMAHLLALKLSGSVLPEHQGTLKSAFIVAIDLEWWEFNADKITEIGIATLGVCESTTAKPILQLEEMEVNHLRVRENAHLVNGKMCEGHPEDFSFGKTAFVNKAEASEAVKTMFTQVDENNNILPVILLGHAVDNDVDVLRDHFGFDLAALGNVIMVLDTQVMASELGLNGGKKMSLAHILSQYQVKDPHLHNAGNDAGQTVVAAALLAGERATGKGRYADGNQGDVNTLKAHLLDRAKWYWGIPTFCTTCESTEHLASGCTKKFSCARCKEAALVGNKEDFSHPTEKCPLPEFPCQACLQSSEPYRKKSAYSHDAKNCGIEKRKSYIPAPFKPAK